MLTITGLAALAGIAVGYAFKGHLRRAGDVSFAGRPLVFGALAIMVFGSLVDLGDAPDRALVALGYALVAAFIVVNVRRTSGALRVALAILALGWSLNAAVILTNGGMPLSQAAYAASGQTEVPTPGTAGFFKIVIADEGTVLRPLGDVLPIKALHQVISVGDVVLMLGLAAAIAAAMTSRKGSSPRLVAIHGLSHNEGRERSLRLVSSNAD